MRFVDEYRSNEKVQTLLEAIRKKVTRPWYIMEICGGQTHAIARYRLEEMLPPDLQLLHGPGCPVCVTPVETIDYALKLATQPNVILASFGDMMRVPGSKEDLLSVKPRGADIRIASPVLEGGEAAPHRIQGIGANFIPKLYDASVVDEVISVPDDEAIRAGRELAATEGLLAGISSGAAVYAARLLAGRPEFKNKKIVALLPDTGERYLSTELFAFDAYPLD